MQYLLVGFGGIFGSIVRFKLGKVIMQKASTTYPTGTFIINITGAILLGFVNSLGMADNLYLFLADGFLGAYTTFSTFMYEGFNLFQENKKLNAFTYILGSLFLGIIGFVIGAQIGKLLI
jgi:fluoride exporter